MIFQLFILLKTINRIKIISLMNYTFKFELVLSTDLAVTGFAMAIKTKQYLPKVTIVLIV